MNDILGFSIELARLAGQIILQGSDAILRSTSDDVEEKKNAVDLVTKYDKEVEDLVRKRVNDTWPSFGL